MHPLPYILGYHAPPAYYPRISYTLLPIFLGYHASLPHPIIPNPNQRRRNMPNHDTPQPANRLSRQSFDEAAAALGIAGPADHLDELYNQLQNVLATTASLRNLNVTNAEPDLAFLPAGPQIPTP